MNAHAIVKLLLAETDFEAANARIHPVNTQWHYKILTQAGFEPETLEATGFVRVYKYNHPDGRSVTCHTGVNSDYWQTSDGKFGYWSDLKKYANLGS